MKKQLSSKVASEEQAETGLLEKCMTQEEIETFLKTAEETSKRLKEGQMCFMIKDSSGKLITKSKVRGSLSVWNRTASGKIALARRTGHAPRTIIFGSEFPIAGCAIFEYEDANGNAAFGYAAASGSLKPSNDLTVVTDALNSIGFEACDDFVFRKKAQL